MLLLLLLLLLLLRTRCVCHPIHRRNVGAIASFLFFSSYNGIE